jgi:hypothetical protein
MAVGFGSSIAEDTLSTVSGLAKSGAIEISKGLATAIPIAGALISIGTVVFGLLHNSRGLQQNVETTHAANQTQQTCEGNLAAWNESNKSLANQALALKNFDQAWEAMQNYCGQASEGSPGQRCISERKRGGKYDWFAAYRDPIANDPQAGVIDRQMAAQQSASATPATAVITAAGPDLQPRMLILIAAGAGLLWALS